jgi:hypothetical protein
MRFRVAGLVVVSLLSAASAPVSATAMGSSSAPHLAMFRLTGDVARVSGSSAWHGDSIVWFDKRQALARLVDPTYYVLRPDSHGKATLGIEAFDGADVLAVQLAIDKHNGFQLIAVGTTSVTRGTNVDAKAANDTAGATATASGHQWGRWYTEWSDPFYIPVSTVKTWIDWYYSGGTVDSFTAGDFPTAFAENGWHQIYHYFSKHWDRTETKGVADTGLRHQTSSWFPSPTCGTSTIYYSYNEAVAYGDGHIGGSVTTWVNSGCAFLLTWNAGPGYS